jgi:two-component system chemotaxis response regulator CheB
MSETNGHPLTTDSSMRGVVALGASAGGVEALQTLLGHLPADLPAPVLVVLHMPSDTPSALVRILSRVCELPVEAATDRSPLRAGHVVVAQPDRHLLVRDAQVRLGAGPRENGQRPAVDATFRSVARWYGERAVGVICSGALDDGAAGALALSVRGGMVLVQDPEEAMYDGMPASALRAVSQATVAPLRVLAGEIAERLKSVDPLVEYEPPSTVPPELALEAAMAELDDVALQQPERPGTPAGLSCPDCHGALFEIDEQSLVRYRCRVGHAWSPENLLVQQNEELEGALWMALRELEDRAALHRRMASSARSGGHGSLATQSEARSADAARSAELIRELLLRQNSESQLAQQN